MWILCGATGIDDVDVRRHLIHGAEPRFRSQSDNAVCVVVDVSLGIFERQLQLCAPDSVIGTRFGEVISGRCTGFVLARNEFTEDHAGAIQYLRVECALKDCDAGAGE